MKPIKKPIRSKSGITPLTVVLPPKKCDHGTCIYCPGGDHVPQSYTDKSPAIMRAMALKYDIKKQTKTRLESLKAMGHPTEKLEVIIIGGTFLQYLEKFKQNYIKGIYDVLNMPQHSTIRGTPNGAKAKTLTQAKKINETAKHRVVALCIENRPDNCTEKDIKEMLSYGTTRVEIGVQIPDDKVYKKTNRGHTVKDVIEATKRLKDAGFKVGYHIMPGVPFSNKKLDKKKFKLIFKSQKFKPDQLKIYPCQIVESAPLEKIYKKINYKPYTNEEISKFIKWIMNKIPRYVRVMRMMREIPKEKMKIEAASTSMRGDLQKELRKNKNIKEIRFREIGQQKGKIDLNTKLKITKYKASKGKEYFLEIINKDHILFGLLRLRFPSKEVFIEELKGAAIVRELHVYGQALNLGETVQQSSHSASQKLWNEEAQHRGMGKQLMKKAEELSKKRGYKKLAVISGIGVREYYKKLGYNLEGDYMVKKFY
ncbi:tRNA uridine(34) 5-carboxymethylaminomethyl modification radical SAM/GNAT enzyme Elp3 [archaeon]|jgi:elongator complex protein 3|nr:tRNA uridine(34) 5-carboxymethylaminomethyl modification radical SAM/GNAT enzyme Elp3 [archaeon]